MRMKQPSFLPKIQNKTLRLTLLSLGLGLVTFFFIFLIVFLLQLQNSWHTLKEKALTEEFFEGQKVFTSSQKKFLFFLHNQTPFLFEKVSLKDVSFSCIQSILNTEDQNFLDHEGLDYKGILRAFLANLQARRLVQGGSTLTQQYIKNAFLSSEKTLSRKLLEARLSLWIENHLSKDEILERYLNVVYFGQVGSFEIRGIQAASQLYFNSPAHTLDWPQCLVLSALLKGPNQFHPIKKAEALKKRYQTLLEKLVTKKILNQEDLSRYSELPPMSFHIQSQTVLNAASYMSSIEEIPDSPEIWLTMIPFIQNTLQSLTGSHLKSLKKNIQDYKEPSVKASIEASVVVVDRKTHHVIAMINGQDPRLSPFPRALKAKRQIGSLIKPFIFYEYFKKFPRQDAQEQLIEDEPFSLKIGSQQWTPQNYDKKFRGSVSLEQALSESLNIPAVKIGLSLNYKDWFPEQKHPSLLLGALEMSPLEVTKMYLKIDQGIETPLIFFQQQNLTLNQKEEIDLIEEKEADTDTTKAHLARDQVWSILKKASESGTSKALSLNPHTEKTCFGKTGTTSGFKDSWFAGFTESYLVVVWLGSDTNENTHLTGSSGALPLFIKIAEVLQKQNSNPSP
jgi:penicillin-binding protein 1B